MPRQRNSRKSWLCLNLSKITVNEPIGNIMAKNIYNSVMLAYIHKKDVDSAFKIFLETK